MKNKKIYHFIGIGGISMSALARILYESGGEITGSDINPEISLPFCEVSSPNALKNIEKADCVVYNSAIKLDDKELVYAKKLNKQILSRAELLGIIAKAYENVIAISGMHGKTSTTEMIAECFIEAGLKPTVHIGGISNKFNSNLLIGGKEFFITEACEYADSFLTLRPDMAVILNIEAEHLDYFKNIKNIYKSFKQYEDQSKNIVSLDKLNIKNSIKFGKNGDYVAKNIRKGKNNSLLFQVYRSNKFYCNFEINSIVQKNIDNALACIAVCDFFEIEKYHIYNALKNYCGVKRRMQILRASPLIIQDYAHHPSELNATISSVKEFYNDKKILVAFQPHTFTRTHAFFEDFVKVLLKSDELFLIKTYPAREEEIKGATAFDLFEAVRKIKPQTHYFDNFETAEKEIKKHLKPNNLLLILGAGDVEKLFSSSSCYDSENVCELESCK